MLRADDPMVVTGKEQNNKQGSRADGLQATMNDKNTSDAAREVEGSGSLNEGLAEATSTLDPWTLVSLGSDALKEKNHTEAVDFFSQALEIL